MDLVFKGSTRPRVGFRARCAIPVLAFAEDKSKIAWNEINLSRDEYRASGLRARSCGCWNGNEWGQFSSDGESLSQRRIDKVEKLCVRVINIQIANFCSVDDRPAANSNKSIGTHALCKVNCLRQPILSVSLFPMRDGTNNLLVPLDNCRKSHM